MLNVNEIFRSIDGEVNPWGQGAPTTFIRLQGCNLFCDYCFGIVKGRRIPRITYSRTPNKRLDEVSIGDKLMTFSEVTQELVETSVIRTHRREVNNWLRITIKGIQYFVTEEHPFYTTKGLIPAKQLVVGDLILHSTFQQKISFQKKIDNPMKNTEIARRSAQNTDYKKQGESIRASIKKRKEKGTYISPWNLLTDTQKENVRQKISKANSKENNGNWGGGLHQNYEALKKQIKERKIVRCSSCNATNKPLDVHHKDGDRDNDNPDNLEILCESCHYSDHKIGYNFWKNSRIDGKEIRVCNGYAVEKIKKINRLSISPSIRPKALSVFNITCAPYNSYLIDNMWVHNCDTKYALNQNKIIHKLSVEDILEIIPKGKVTITGGEPLLQKETKNLIIALLDKKHKVSVETNGSILIPTIIMNDDNLSWIIDYKLDAQDKMYIPNFWETTEKDWVKIVIAVPSDFQKAIDIIEALQAGKCKARFALSPVININNKKLMEWGMADPIQWLANKIIEKQINVILNLQIHKLIWPNKKEGISLL